MMRSAQNLCPRVLIFLRYSSFFGTNTNPILTKGLMLCPSFTSRDETDSAEEACFCVIHLNGQELVGKSEHQVSERAEASIVHLRPVEGQPI